MRISAAASALTARWRSRVPAKHSEPRGYYPGLNERVPGTSEYGGAGTRFSYLTAGTSPR